MRPKNIILITIDTLRADRLGCYGYGRPTTPVLDALAAEGARFGRAYAAAPYTVPSHASILTGLYPNNHSLGLVQKDGELDRYAEVTLAEALRGAGYRTGAFVSTFVLRRSFGLDSGFDVYDDEMTGTEMNRESQPLRDGRLTNRAALSWLEGNRDERVFVWVHYFDAHGPYVQPEGFNGPFVPGDYAEDAIRLGVVEDGMPGGIPMYQALNPVRDGAGGLVSCEDDIRAYLAGYDNGVRYQDTVFGEFIDGLKGLGMYDDSLIVVTADHGEALGEDGVYFFHGLTVTPEQTAVPLIVKPHSEYARLTPSAEPVSTVDIMPTLLDIAGVDRKGLRLDGAPLFGGGAGNRLVQSENEWQRALIGDGVYLASHKEVVYDGFEYYFDSRSLLRGDRLWDLETGRPLGKDASGRAARLFGYLETLRTESDPKERRIKSAELQTQGLRAKVRGLGNDLKNKEKVIAHKQAVIEEKSATVKELYGELGERKKELAALGQELRVAKMELESVYSSKSWKITKPVRWFSARLKGNRE